MQIENDFIRNTIFVVAWSFRIFVNGLAFFGISLITYAALSTYYNSSWPLIESWAPFISSILTLIGTIFTAASIYFYSENTTPPEKISIFITAPIINSG